MAVTGLEGAAFLVGRVLFGGVLAFMGLNHFLDRQSMVGYADHKGLPAPTAAVLLSGLVLVLGGLAIVLGVYPVLGAFAIAGFLLVSAVLLHDFWAVPDDQVEAEMTNFLKNVSLAGAALAIAAVGTQAWTYSLGVGLA